MTELEDIILKQDAEIERLQADISDNHIIMDCRKETIEELQEQLATRDEEIAHFRAERETATFLINMHISKEEGIYKQLVAKDIELANALSDLKHEKERVEVMHLRRENELRQMNELGTQNKDLMANCNQLRDRCWKAEGELARWQKIATDLKAAEIQNANSGDFVDARGNHIFQVIDLEKCRERAAEELNLQVTREAGYIERLEDAFVGEVTDALWMAGADNPREKAQADLAKIREGNSGERVGTGAFRIDPPESTKTRMLTKEQRAALEYAIRNIDIWPSDYITSMRSMLSSPPAWEVTEERKAAIWHGVMTINTSQPDCTLKNCADTLQAMLEEVTK